MAIRKSGGDSSNLDQPQSLRDIRIEQRHQYTDACSERGADGDGIRRGTNRIYEETFGGKPKGGRDEWPDEHQQKIAVSENFAANRVRGLPTPQEGSSQEEANDRVVEASGQGARAAKEYIADQSDNGNWWSRLWGN